MFIIYFFCCYIIVVCFGVHPRVCIRWFITMRFFWIQCLGYECVWMILVEILSVNEGMIFWKVAAACSRVWMWQRNRMIQRCWFTRNHACRYMNLESGSVINNRKFWWSGNAMFVTAYAWVHGWNSGGGMLRFYMM